LECQILRLNGFVNPYSQVKWIFSTKMAQHKALVLFKLNSHAKMAPDSVEPLDNAVPDHFADGRRRCAASQGRGDDGGQGASRDLDQIPDRPLSASARRRHDWPLN
jgi:hypothetical protein